MFSYTVADHSVTITSYKGKNNYIVFPEKIKNNPVTVIGKNSTTSSVVSSHVKEILIPKSVKTVNPNAFAKCDQLERVVLSEGVEELKNSAFLDCRKLKEINFPETLNSIGDTTFSGCISLEKVSFSSDNLTIGDSAFEDCSNLTNVSFRGKEPHINQNSFNRTPWLKGLASNSWERNFFYYSDGRNVKQVEKSKKEREEKQAQQENYFHMQLTFSSTCFSEIGYNPVSQTLRVCFRTTGYYQYRNFSQEDYNKFCAADSLGTYFDKHIKGHYEYHKEDQEESEIINEIWRDIYEEQTKVDFYYDSDDFNYDG